MKRLILLLVLFLISCGSNTGVVPIGDDTYKIYKRGATGFVGSDAIKTDVMLQASQFCAERGKTLHVVNVLLGNPPYIFGNFPKAEVQFRCVEREPPAGSSVPALLAEVAFESNVVNADVFVDGDFVGNTPLTALKLNPGTHEIEIKANGYLPWKRELTVAATSSTRVMAELQKSPDQ